LLQDAKGGKGTYLDRTEYPQNQSLYYNKTGGTNAQREVYPYVKANSWVLA